MRRLYTDFHNGCTICNSHKQWTKVPFLQILFNICCHLFFLTYFTSTNTTTIILLSSLLFKTMSFYESLAILEPLPGWPWTLRDLPAHYAWLPIVFLMNTILTWESDVKYQKSLRAKNVEYILKYLLTICVSLSENSVQLLSLLNFIFYFFRFLGFLHILDISYLWCLQLTKFLSHSEGWIFTQFTFFCFIKHFYCHEVPVVDCCPYLLPG